MNLDPTHPSYRESLPWLWEITQDHLADEFDFDSEVGITGPHNGTKTPKAKPHTFRMYDDDGELYYTGVLYVSDETLDSDDMDNALGSPLWDFGAPNAGAVTIKYHGHPEWEI